MLCNSHHSSHCEKPKAVKLTPEELTRLADAAVDLMTEGTHEDEPALNPVLCEAVEKACRIVGSGADPILNKLNDFIDVMADED